MTILRTIDLVGLLAVLALTARALAGPGSAADERPNIILFVSDDHRADVLGCAGHPIVRTPNIDKLAAEGVRFSNSFVTTSICAASRATILTGVVERTHRFTFGTPPLARPFCEDSYPERLRARGYRTGFVGKLGISVVDGRATLDRMFDSFVPLGVNPYVKTMPDGSTRHVTDLTGDQAIEFIQSNPQGQPFCLSVSFNAAHADDGNLVDHYPYPAAETDLYRGVAMPRPRLERSVVAESLPDFFEGSLNRRRYFWRWDTPEKYERNLRNYFRMLSGLDRNVGRVMDELVSQGLEQSTVVIFTGDNGYYMGERGFAGKWSHYEESLRVPLVIRDPRTPPALRGQVVEAIALNLDLAPTILDVAGIESPARYQGRSLVPFTRSAEAPDEREGFYCEHRMKHPNLPRWEGYHGSRYVYARYLDVDAGGELLHDLEQDPRQLRNCVGDEAYASVLTRLRVECRRRADLYAAAAEPSARDGGSSVANPEP